MFSDRKSQKDIAEKDTEINISRKHRLLKKEKRKEKRRMEMEQNAAKQAKFSAKITHIQESAGCCYFGYVSLSGAKQTCSMLETVFL